MHVTYFFYWWSSLYNVQIVYIQIVYSVYWNPPWLRTMFMFTELGISCSYTQYTLLPTTYSVSESSSGFILSFLPRFLSLPSILYTLISRSLPPCILLSTFSHPSSFHLPPLFPFPSPPSSPLFFQSFPFHLPCLFLPSSSQPLPASFPSSLSHLSFFHLPFPLHLIHSLILYLQSIRARCYYCGGGGGGWGGQAVGR